MRDVAVAARPTTGFELLALDPNYSGSCPCFTAVIDGTRLNGHCWRTCSECPYAGLHYEGDRAVAVWAKGLLDAMDWYGEWALQEGAIRDA